MAAPNQITGKQLARLIGTPDCPTLIDLRINEDFAEDPRFIPGAFRQPFVQIETLVPDLIGKSVVTICHKGLKISQGAAALLRSHGIKAEALMGGHCAWAAQGLPLIKSGLIPDRNSLWVARHRPKIDRIACPWLIRRFIDPTARFLFVEPGQVLAVADKFNAIAFDEPDCDWTHQDDLCTFDALLSGFKLHSPSLNHMARIIRAADTDTLDKSPEAAGLRALSLGLSRMCRDDLEQLAQGLILYDALYRWARDATGETHTWEHSE